MFFINERHDKLHINQYSSLINMCKSFIKRGFAAFYTFDFFLYSKNNFSLQFSASFCEIRFNFNK